MTPTKELEKTMQTGQLAAALRNKAAEVRNINVTTAEEDQTLRDAADLLRVLAHVVDGKTLVKAFGSPGDWGYETAIGAALSRQVACTDGLGVAVPPAPTFENGRKHGT